MNKDSATPAVADGLFEGDAKDGDRRLSAAAKTSFSKKCVTGAVGA
jgi:hypothetical protein